MPRVRRNRGREIDDEAETVLRVGNIIGRADLLRAMPQCGRAVANWTTGFAPTWQQRVEMWALRAGAKLDRIHDVAHGRRSLLIVYRDEAEREACIQHRDDLTRISKYGRV